MGARFGCFGYAGFSVSSIMAATLIGAAAPALAEKWEYPVSNPGDASSYGLYTNDVYYAPQCADPGSRKCLPREHYFTFLQNTALGSEDDCPKPTLTVDFVDKKAVLSGCAVASNADKTGNQMRWRLDVTFSEMRPCEPTDPLRWPSSWGKQIPLKENGSDDPLRRDGWKCFGSITGSLFDLVGGDEVKLTLAEPKQPMQIGVDADGVLEDGELGGFFSFFSSAGGTKTWELAMTLDPGTPVKEQSKQFTIDACPGSGDQIEGPRQDCKIDWYGDESFLTRINNEEGVVGTVTLDGLLDILDERPQCDPKANFGPSNPPPRTPLLIPSSTTGAGDVIVPWFLCGIPGEDDKPLIRLINADSDFSGEGFQGILDSVVDQEAKDPADLASTDKYHNVLYACDNADLKKWKFQPVVAWLPRQGDEIPIVVPDGADTDEYPDQVQEIRDITNECGSARGGTPDLSYLLSNLVYSPFLEPQDFHEIIRAEIDMLENTLALSADCISKETSQSTLSILFPDLYDVKGQSRLLDHIANNFDAGNYDNVVNKLEWLLGELTDAEGSLRDSFKQCYADYKGYVYDTPNPGAGIVVEPKNFRGDLEAQIKHVIFNIKEKDPAPL